MIKYLSVLSLSLTNMTQMTQFSINPHSKYLMVPIFIDLQKLHAGEWPSFNCNGRIHCHGVINSFCTSIGQPVDPSAAGFPNTNNPDLCPLLS